MSTYDFRQRYSDHRDSSYSSTQTTYGRGALFDSYRLKHTSPEKSYIPQHPALPYDSGTEEGSRFKDTPRTSAFL